MDDDMFPAVATLCTKIPKRRKLYNIKENSDKLNVLPDSDAYVNLNQDDATAMASWSIVHNHDFIVANAGPHFDREVWELFGGLSNAGSIAPVVQTLRRKRLHWYRM